MVAVRDPFDVINLYHLAIGIAVLLPEIGPVISIAVPFADGILGPSSIVLCISS